MIEEARKRAAERYPAALVDSMGREHRCIPREAILSGAWDGGSLVLAEVERLQGDAIPLPRLSTQGEG